MMNIQFFNISIFQYFNISIFQFFNFLIFQYFNISIFQFFNSSVKKPQQPQWNLIVASHLGVKPGIYEILVHTFSVRYLCVAYPEPQFVVNSVVVVLRGLVHLVVFPHGVDKECFHHILLFHGNGVDGIHQVGVVHHHP